MREASLLAGPLDRMACVGPQSLGFVLGIGEHQVDPGPSDVRILKLVGLAIEFREDGQPEDADTHSGDV